MQQQASADEMRTPREANTVAGSSGELVAGAFSLHREEEGQLNSSPSLPKVQKEPQLSTTDLATLGQAPTQCQTTRHEMLTSRDMRQQPILLESSEQSGAFMSIRDRTFIVQNPSMRYS